MFVAGQIAFFIIFFLKIRTDFVPMNESDVKVKGPSPYSIERLKPRFMVDALSIEILLSKKSLITGVLKDEQVQDTTFLSRV